MTVAVVRQWVDRSWLRALRKKKQVPQMIAELRAIEHRAFLPKVIVDIWYSDYCYEEDDFIGQWADDGGPLHDLSP